MTVRRAREIGTVLYWKQEPVIPALASIDGHKFCDSCQFTISRHTLYASISVHRHQCITYTLRGKTMLTSSLR